MGSARRRDLGTLGILGILFTLALVPAVAPAQMGGGMGPGMGRVLEPRGRATAEGGEAEPRRAATPNPNTASPGARVGFPAQMSESMPHQGAPAPFYLESTFLLLVGAAIAAGGLVVYRVSRARWRRQPGPPAVVTEAVLVVDLVQSTHLATHYGDGVAMRARTLVRDRALTLAASQGLTSSESTGDGCLMTFGLVTGAVETALALLADMEHRATDLAPAPPPSIRAAVTYGEILLDGQGARHGAVINKAFRLEGLAREAFVRVEGRASGADIPEHDRIFLDEAAAEEARAAGFRVDAVGYCALKGFAGLHGVSRLLP